MNGTDGLTDVEVQLKLPATSANLGPGFDALGLALDLHLHVTASPAASTSLEVTGRDSAKLTVGNPDENLILRTYREVLAAAGESAPNLDLHIHNEIPLGMGCGSSAAALVAGVALANRIGNLGWERRQILTEAARREGHPDNVAACVLGGFTASAMRDGVVEAISFPPAAPWQFLLALPGAGLATKTARALLPDVYSREDAVTNLQNVALLTAAFFLGEDAVLRSAMADRVHQPYRAEVCPLLPLLLPLAGKPDVLGVALSGAGPSVLLVVRPAADRGVVEDAARRQFRATQQDVEMLWMKAGAEAELNEKRGVLPSERNKFA